MRSSPLKHPVAILRTTLGLGQKEFGYLVGRAWRTIQSIELGNLPLSTKLAERISDETGVSFDWLMKGDPDAPIMAEHGRAWRRDAYFDAQGRKLLPGTVLGQHYATDLLNLALAKVCAAIIAAAESKNIRSHTWRILNGIDKAMEDLKGYPDLVHEFNQILVNHMKDTKAGREAVIAEAVKRIRHWKEPRRKRAAKR